MSVITPKSCWLHVPKTGGIWVEKVLLTCVEGARMAQSRHLGLGCCPDERFVFAFVRHPYTWYQSYWCYKQKKGWDRANRFDQRCGSNKFDEFIDKMFERDSCHYTKVINYMMGDGEGIDFVGRFENLREDLLKALELSGDVLKADIDTVKPINRSNPEHKEAAQYAPHQKEKVAEYDHEVFVRFGYSKEE